MFDVPITSAAVMFTPVLQHIVRTPWLLLHIWCGVQGLQHWLLDALGLVWSEHVRCLTLHFNAMCSMNIIAFTNMSSLS